MFEESAKLMEKAFNEYSLVDLTCFYNFNKKIKVLEGQSDYVEIGTKEKFFYPLKNDEIKNIKIEYKIQDVLEAPITKDYEIGNVKIFIDNNLLFSEKIYTMEEVRRNSIWEKLKDLIENW